MCNQVQILNSFVFCKCFPHLPDAVGSALLLRFQSPVYLTATARGRDENYMQNGIFHGQSLNPQTAEKSVVNSMIPEDYDNAHIRSVIFYSQSYPNSFHCWREMFPNISRKVWTKSNRFLIPSKVKEVHIKLLHRYYSCNEFIKKFRPDVSPLCSFCKEVFLTFILWMLPFY